MQRDVVPRSLVRGLDRAVRGGAGPVGAVGDVVKPGSRTSRVKARAQFLQNQMGFKSFAMPSNTAWLRLLARLARAEIKIEEFEERLTAMEESHEPR